MGLRQASGRWYSSEAEAKSDEQAKAASKEAESVEDPLRKELDAKNKEVIDLKVGCLLFYLQY